MRSFAHHSSFRARQDLAHYNSVLVKRVKDHPDRTVNAETVMGIIAVATRAYVMFGNAPSRRQLEDIAIRPVLQMIVSVLRHPEKLQCYNQVYEAFYCISSITQRCRAECRATPGLLPLIAACTRSASFFIRDYSVMAFLGLHADEHEAEGKGFDLDRYMIAATEDPPKHLRALLVDFGLERSELSVFARSLTKYQEALMLDPSMTTDVRVLGRKLSELIQASLWGFSVSLWLEERGSGFGVEAALLLPQWAGLIPLAIKALREQPNASMADRDAADIIEMTLMMEQKRRPEATALGHSTTKRNPWLGYAYYIISMATEDSMEVIPAAKKALQCANLTPFVRTEMLWRASVYAIHYGSALLNKEQDHDPDAVEEAAACFMSALEDVKTYVAEAPPDAMHMSEMLSYQVLLMTILHGHEMDANMKEFEVSWTLSAFLSICHTHGLILLAGVQEDCDIS